jgi:hypothetical protein
VASYALKRAGLPSLLWGLSLSGPAPAEPAELGLHVTWRAPEECPQALEVTALVERLLARAASALPRIEVAGVVSRQTDGSYELLLETEREGYRGTRALRAASCAELSDAAATVIAFAVNPEFRVERGAAVSDSSTTRPSTPESPPAPPAPARLKKSVEGSAARTQIVPTRAAPVSTPLEGYIGANFAAELGTLPGLAPGVGLSMFGVYSWASFGLSGIWLPPRHAAARGITAIGGDIDFRGLELSGCAGHFARPLTTAACLGFGVGRLHGESTGASEPGAGNVLWLVPQVGFVVRYRLTPRLTSHLGAKVLIPLQGADFTVGSVGSVYQPSSFAGRLETGIEWRFW